MRRNGASKPIETTWYPRSIPWKEGNGGMAMGQRNGRKMAARLTGLIFILLASVVALLILLEKSLRLQTNLFMSLLITGLILAIIYGVPTWIIFRNVNLQGFLKYFFSFTITPLFIALMCLNIVWTYKFAPSLFQWFHTLGALSRPADVSFFLSYIYFYGFGALFMVVIFLISCSISIPLCYGWYRLLLRLDQRRPKHPAGETPSQ